MSLFRFKISSLDKERCATRNAFGNFMAPTAANAFGFPSSKSEEIDNCASQFSIDESDLWNDDEKDVFEPVKSKKEQKKKLSLSSPKKDSERPEEPDGSFNKENETTADSPHEPDFSFSVINSSKEPEEISFPHDVIEDKEDQNLDMSLTEHEPDFSVDNKENSKDVEEISFRCDAIEDQAEDQNEFNFELGDYSMEFSPIKKTVVEESDDDTLPGLVERHSEHSKSPTFNVSHKSVKKKNSVTSDYKNSDSGSENYYLNCDVSKSSLEKDNKGKSEGKGNAFDFCKEKLNPLGLAEETNQWLSNILQNEAFCNVTPDTSRGKLEKNLEFLNKVYVDILEKVMVAFESLPLELLKQFPGFDQNVFMTLRTTRSRVKAIIIKTDNLIKRKNLSSVQVEDKREGDKVSADSFQFESPVPRDYSRIMCSPTLNSSHNSVEDFSISKSTDVFTFKLPSKLNKSAAEPKLNFPLLNTPKPNASMRSSVPVDSSRSSTPLVDSEAKQTPSARSEMIDYTDTLYKTPVKDHQDKNSGSGRFPSNMRNDGATGEFDGSNFPHSKELYEKFRQKFGLRSFRPNQLQVINAALLGHDCFVLMPTGGGKSLCYQLPALVSAGVTVVVSPLRSLILDQVTKLLTLDISAAHLCGDVKESEANAVYRRLNQPEPSIKLLYVTPEKVGASSALRNCILGLYKRNMLARFVIDEAHCVSQWGHDFRPDYKKLRELRENYPKVNIMALTATATPRVRTDILHQLKIGNPKWFLSSFNRSNLVYSVREKKGRSAVKEIANLILEEFKKDTGVIYCLSRKECEDVAEDLKKFGIAAIPYHAGLNDNERTRAQNLWMNNKVKIVCATIAFGMGIDKLDVRFVIHFSLPKSIEGYYQESGRAGRDGEKAKCILFYSYKDKIRMLKLINMDKSLCNQAARKVHVDNLFRVVAFAENKTDCRRALQLEYFGEKFNRKNCIEDRNTACDNCLQQGAYEVIDVTKESKAIVKSVREVCGEDDRRNSNYTMLHFVEVFKGTLQKKILAEGHDGLPLYGLGKSWLRIDVERLFRKLIMEEFLKERLLVKDDGITFAYIKFGRRGEELLKGNIQIMFEVKKRKGSSSAQAVNVVPEKRVDPAVLEIQEKCYSDLLSAIHEIASSINCNPNAIMNVQALRAMSNSLPETPEEMLSINHVTTANFEKYGSILLEITKKYSAEKKSLQIMAAPEEDIFVEEAWLNKDRNDSPYFETDITFEGRGKDSRKRKRSNNYRRNTKKWKGGSGSGKATSSKSTAGKSHGKSAASTSGCTTIAGAKFSTLMELPTNKGRFDRPKVLLKNL